MEELRPYEKPTDTKYVRDEIASIQKLETRRDLNNLKKKYLNGRMQFETNPEEAGYQIFDVLLQELAKKEQTIRANIVRRTRRKLRREESQPIGVAPAPAPVAAPAPAPAPAPVVEPVPVAPAPKSVASTTVQPLNDNQPKSTRSTFLKDLKNGAKDGFSNLLP